MLLDYVKHGLDLAEDQHTMLTHGCSGCQISLPSLLYNTNATLMEKVPVNNKILIK